MTTIQEILGFVFGMIGAVALFVFLAIPFMLALGHITTRNTPS